MFFWRICTAVIWGKSYEKSKVLPVILIKFRIRIRNSLNELDLLSPMDLDYVSVCQKNTMKPKKQNNQVDDKVWLSKTKLCNNNICPPFQMIILDMKMNSLYQLTTSWWSKSIKQTKTISRTALASSSRSKSLMRVSYQNTTFFLKNHTISANAVLPLFRKKFYSFHLIHALI